MLVNVGLILSAGVCYTSSLVKAPSCLLWQEGAVLFAVCFFTQETYGNLQSAWEAEPCSILSAEDHRN